MITKEFLPTIEKETKEFFEELDAELDGVKIELGDESTVKINLDMADPGLFIGQQGQVLGAIQHLLKILLRRKIGTTEGSFFVDLDINDYKKNKTAYLKDLAQETATDVALTKKEKELAPMPAQDRRIIHLELSQRQDVTTESIGESEERRVVVKPKT